MKESTRKGAELLVNETIKQFGYHPFDLKLHSKKKIVAKCKICARVYLLRYADYNKRDSTCSNFCGSIKNNKDYYKGLLNPYFNTNDLALKYKKTRAAIYTNRLYFKKYEKNNDPDRLKEILRYISK